MKDWHANDCEYGKKTEETMDDYTRKLKSMSKTTNNEADAINRANGTCVDYASFRLNVSCHVTKGCHQT